MNARQKNELAEALLACANVSARASRDTILADLSERIRNGIQRGPTDAEDVANIIRTCLNYANGLEELVAIVRVYEHDSVAIQNVDRLLLHLFDFQIEEAIGLRLLAIIGDVDTDLERLRKFYRELLPQGVGSRGEPLGLFTMLAHLWNLSCRPDGLTRQRTFPIVDFVTQLALLAGPRRVAGELRSWADKAQRYLYQAADSDPTASPIALGPVATNSSQLAVFASVLASLYPTIETASELVAAARLNSVNIQFRDLALPNWQNILAEAARRNRVKAIVEAALAAHPRHPWLTLARRELRQAEPAPAQVAASAAPSSRGLLQDQTLEPFLPTSSWPRDGSFFEQALACARSVVRVTLDKSQSLSTSFLTHNNLMIAPSFVIRSVEEA